MKDLSESRILVVDDSKDSVEVLVQALRADYKLSVALSGEAALKFISKTTPDLVLLDVMMPGISGYDVCRQLRKRPDFEHVPIMFLSARDEAESKVEGFEAGGTDYITKPFELLELKARVRSLLKAKAFTDAAKELLAHDLRVAHDIQMGMVMHDFSGLAERAPVDVHGVLEPAKEVGGDLYHAEFLDDRHLGFVVGDVSGKGIPAAIFMAVATTLIKTHLRQLRDPARVLQLLNDYLSVDNPSSMFVTLLCGILDVTTGKVACSSGGHTIPLHVRPDGRSSFIGLDTGMAAGILPGLTFATFHLQLGPGETFVAYTDGVTEEFNPHDQYFSDERLLEHFSKPSLGPSKRLVDDLLAHVRAFAEGEPQSDDIAVLAIRYLGAAS
ncbi:MAG: fused response regulator/phosphatase [Myxococcales bacterium]